MRFTENAILLLSLAVGYSSAFSPTCRGCTTNKGAFLPTSAAVSFVVKPHPSSCPCNVCIRGQALFAEEGEDAEESAEVVPPEVEAMDGVESPEEAHNTERPARESLKKKRPAKGKALSELEIGSSVQGKVKTITNYGAFLDIGAATDGLLHISNLSAGFVSDVSEFLTVGQELEVRILNVDEGKNQVGLSLLSAEEEAAAKENSRPQRQQRGGGGGGDRRDDSAVTSALAEKGFDPEQFVAGTVVSTVDFGCFVRFDASLLNSEVEGEMDGLVHISALRAGRVESVDSVVKEGDDVQVRVKSINGRKVSLSMVSVEDEKSSRQNNSAPEPVGAADWKERLEAAQDQMPSFVNGPIVVDMRK